MKNDDHVLQEVFNKYCSMITSRKMDYKYTLKFTSRNKPTIEPFDYLKRISKYSELPASIFAAGQILAKKAFTYGFDKHMIHRIIFISTYLAFKMYIDDKYIKLKTWSNISGLPVNEIINLEFCMLIMLDYKLFIKEEEFLKNYKTLNLFKIEDL